MLQGVWAVLVLLTAGLVLAWWLRIARGGRGEASLRQLQSLMRIISWVQRHRGLSMGYLNGKHNAKPQLKSVEQQVDDESKMLSRLLQDGTAYEVKRAWREAAVSLQGLAALREEREALLSMQQHTDLIGQLFACVEKTADSAGLTSAGSHFQRTLALYCLRTLPQLVEDCGQLRAYSAICAQTGECRDEVRAAMVQLLEQVQGPAQIQLKDLPSSFDVRRQIGDLSRMVQHEILDVELVEIAVEAIFDRVSLVMQSVQVVIEDGLDLLYAEIA
ncbi:nitrate- and nitrite sensing domain-containing protein [Atopomonas sediminilitoris]|uniref:nitrate- and nitrite sensing domain-containing protein n=1 Tax=Atopomonas sediminilitoris TaxID=2919919 RepID=UPI001F4DC958|nr:nitrate- and nitrite sensing domain-containing protein [Atopomonas sediminilitoris]MCJ8167796.1 nitrate- and nitrite sensing domain-containing protein [Atopomonas sediminilitoris]